MSKPRILVVDDDGPILTLMRTLLREFGFEPRIAMTGAEALTAARDAAPDLVLVDIHMPGMSGADLIHALRNDGLTGVPIVILSGEKLDGEMVSSLGADAAIQKPFDVMRLVELIRSLLLKCADTKGVSR